MKVKPVFIVVAIGVASIAFFMKMNLIHGGGPLLIISLSTLASMFFLRAQREPEFMLESKMQFFIFKLLNYSLALMCIAILFRYQWYPGWTVHFTLGIPALLICTILALYLKGNLWIDENKKIIRQTILIPWIFIVITTVLHFYLGKEKFYNTFSYQRETMSYQQYVDSVAMKQQTSKY